MATKLQQQTDGKEDVTLPNAWDYKGRPALKSSSGGWSAASTIVGAEVCERLTTLGIAVNLVTYLTGTMHLGGATSANTVTNFLGASFMLCLLGGFIADTYLGRYLTIGIFAIVQAAGVTLLTISTIIPSLRPPKCRPGGDSCQRATDRQIMVLYTALYLTALGTGGLKSSVSGFGSDQFDDSDKEETKQMVTFFNWFFFFINVGSLAAVTILVYIQDNLGREWGYGICGCAILVGLVVFVGGTRRYRFKKLVGSPLTQIASVLVAAWRKRHLQLPSDSSRLFGGDIVDQEAGHLGSNMKMKQKLAHSKELRFLDKAAIKDPEMASESDSNKWVLSTLRDVEEVKLVIRMIPTWATTIMFWTVYAQMMTFSVSQATTMDRRIASFLIPPASLTVFFVSSILLTVPVYDRLIVPLCGVLSPLKRIGVGLLLSIYAMIAAALTEIKRLHVAQSHGLTYNPTASVPVSVFWLVPQFVLVGAGVAFTYIGQLDFFLRECPKGMKTMSTGMFLSALSLGFFMSSMLVTLVHRMTRGGKPWLADNLNEGKLYNFYWVLTGLSVLNLGVFWASGRKYVYKEERLQLAEEGSHRSHDDDLTAALH